MGQRSFVPVIHGATGERADEQDTVMAAEAVAASLRRLGYRTQVIGLGLDLRPVKRLAERHPLAVFNLVEALDTDCRTAALVPAMLDRLGLAYTGSRFEALTATASKLRVKQLLAYAGLPTPAWSKSGEGLDPSTRVIVKSVDEHASVGIDQGSIVPAGEAAAEILRRERLFGGSFFAETYVEGREFNISLIAGASGGVEVLPMPEIVFDGYGADRERIVDFDAKWNETSYEYHHTPRLFGVEAREPGLAAELKRIVMACWDLFGIDGYARVDLRVDAAGRPSVIDINTNPCISPDAGLAAAAAESGLPYDALVGRVVDRAAIGRGKPATELPQAVSAIVLPAEVGIGPLARRAKAATRRARVG
ncbi:MAG: hypothetical protein R3D33_01500 [Hyphomicrobiaceae bacterium]